MPMVTFQLPDVKRKTETRPRERRSCKRETFQRWGGVRRLMERCQSGRGGLRWVVIREIVPGDSMAQLAKDAIHDQARVEGRPAAGIR
jgi:hypothetical protein